MFFIFELIFQTARKLRPLFLNDKNINLEKIYISEIKSIKEHKLTFLEIPFFIKDLDKHSKKHFKLKK